MPLYNVIVTFICRDGRKEWRVVLVSKLDIATRLETVKALLYKPRPVLDAACYTSIMDEVKFSHICLFLLYIVELEVYVRWHLRV